MSVDPTSPVFGASAAGRRGRELRPQERAQVQKLRQRDRRVRAHEQAHVRAGGGVTGGAVRYQYRLGPDGKRYAVGGRVTPHGHVTASSQSGAEQAAAVRRAALAPTKPSTQDRIAADQAFILEQKAHSEMEQARRMRRYADKALAAGAAAGLALGPHASIINLKT